MSVTTAAAPARRVGRPCAVCALTADLREQTELALVAGRSISSISRQPGAPGRDSIRSHIKNGHMRQELRERAERALGMDHTTIVARITDLAQRHRETAHEAREASQHALAIRAADAELRALLALAGLGVEDERDVAVRATREAVARAAVIAAGRDPLAAERIAVELSRAGHTDLAEQLLSTISENEGRP